MFRTKYFCDNIRRTDSLLFVLVFVMVPVSASPMMMMMMGDPPRPVRVFVDLVVFLVEGCVLGQRVLAGEPPAPGIEVVNFGSDTVMNIQLVPSLS